MESEECRPRATSPCAAGPSGDPLKRFRATCLRYDALLMGRHVRVETDSPVISLRIAEALGSVEPAQNGHPQFVWRIACESREGSSRMWPSLSGFCDGSLRYISLGQYGFIAADLRAREAIGVLPEALCEDDIGFSTVFLSSLLHLTAPALGLTPVSAACVAKAQNGLLLFGPPNSGKTTAAYCGKKLGLEFHPIRRAFWSSMQERFMPGETSGPRRSARRQRNSFRKSRSLARPFQYRDRDFLCVDKASLSGAHRGRITPAACIFLERKACLFSEAYPFVPLGTAGPGFHRRRLSRRSERDTRVTWASAGLPPSVRRRSVHRRALFSQCAGCARIDGATGMNRALHRAVLRELNFTESRIPALVEILQQTRLGARSGAGWI